MRTVLERETEKAILRVSHFWKVLMYLFRFLKYKVLKDQGKWKIFKLAGHHCIKKTYADLISLNILFLLLRP